MGCFLIVQKQGGSKILRACQYCNRVHDTKFDCGHKPVKCNKETEARKFRHTSAWRKMSVAIKERDGYMCQWCLKNEGHINLTKLEVHHIVPLVEDRELALEPSNLITLCRYHHEQAEKGKISRKDIRALVKTEGSADSPLAL